MCREVSVPPSPPSHHNDWNISCELWELDKIWKARWQPAPSHTTRPIELQMNPRGEKWSQQIDCIFRMVCISTQSRDHTKHYKHHSYSCTHLSHEPYTCLYCNTVLGVRLDDNITIVSQCHSQRQHSRTYIAWAFFCLISCYLAGCPIQSP